MAAPDTLILSGKELSRIGNTKPLSIIVGERRVCPCDHAVFRSFQLWVAKTLTSGNVDIYRDGDVVIEHWDDRAGDKYPNLLNPCECGTYLPMDVDPQPMFASGTGLVDELQKIKQSEVGLPTTFAPLVDAMIKMARLSIATNTPMEIR